MEQQNYPKNKPFVVNLGDDNWQIVKWSEKHNQFTFAGFPISESCFKEWIHLPNGE